MKLVTNNKTFDIKITIGAIKRVKASKNIDLLLDDAEAKKVIDILSNPLTVGEILAGLLEPQFEEQGITEEQVYDLFDGETLQKATDILFEELKVFFKGLRRPGMVLAIEKMLNTLKLSQDTILEKVGELDEKAMFLSGMESMKLPD